MFSDYELKTKLITLCSCPPAAAAAAFKSTTLKIASKAIYWGKEVHGSFSLGQLRSIEWQELAFFVYCSVSGCLANQQIIATLESGINVPPWIL